MACLVAMAGLPGTGKSTIAQALARATGAVYLRIDAIEAALTSPDTGHAIGPEGYRVAAALATSNLSLGQDVVVDCVNPLPVTRTLFADAARRAGAPMMGVEILCSDRALHRHRVEARETGVTELPRPDWTAVLARDYLPWDTADLRIDTASTSVAAALLQIRTSDPWAGAG